MASKFFMKKRLDSGYNLFENKPLLSNVRKIRKQINLYYKWVNLLPIILGIILLVSILHQSFQYKSSFLVKTMQEERDELEGENERIILHSSTASLFQEHLVSVDFVKISSIASMLRIIRNLDEIGRKSGDFRMTGSCGYFDTINFIIVHMLRHSLAQPHVENFNSVPFMKPIEYGNIVIKDVNGRILQNLYYGYDYVIYSKQSLSISNMLFDHYDLRGNVELEPKATNKILYVTSNNLPVNETNGELEFIIDMLKQRTNFKSFIVRVRDFGVVMRKIHPDFPIPVIFLKSSLTTNHASNISIEFDSKKTAIINPILSNIYCQLHGKSNEYILLTTYLDAPNESNSTNFSATGIAMLLDILQTIKRSNQIPKYHLIFYFIAGREQGNCGYFNALKMLKEKSIYGKIIMHLNMHTLGTSGCIPMIRYSNDKLGNEISGFFSRLFTSNDISSQLFQLRKQNHPFSHVSISCRTNNNVDNFQSVSKNALIAVRYH